MLKSYPQKLSTGLGIIKSKFRHTALTCGFVETLDLMCMLCRSVRAASRYSSKAIHGIALGTALCLVTASNANGSINDSDQYKLYLHSKIINYKQFICAVEVGHRESRWNPYSRNKNHFGLFQMENKQVQYMNPYTQIDWWIRYVHKRYDGNYCNSLAHLKKRGWQ